ncbi:hypothetical protein V0288_11150 [Pannus brasiliensis CCIBt3594]|uniref:HTH psq-type domain-containing protein n=1 Tax=Pannus brasiliensis CCIBt3594 TaxID=1427578 RepID=A0AAW9QW64_9CHRO
MKPELIVSRKWAIGDRIYFCRRWWIIEEIYPSSDWQVVAVLAVPGTSQIMRQAFSNQSQFPCFKAKYSSRTEVCQLFNEKGKKLNRGQAKEIKDRLVTGEKQAVLAREFDVSEATISSIKNGRMWQNV